MEPIQSLIFKKSLLIPLFVYILILCIYRISSFLQDKFYLEIIF